jgi:hypothetical protein
MVLLPGLLSLSFFFLSSLFLLSYHLCLFFYPSLLVLLVLILLPS